MGGLIWLRTPAKIFKKFITVVQCLVVELVNVYISLWHTFLRNNEATYANYKCI